MAVTIGSVTEGNANAEEIKNNLPDSELYEKNKKYLQGSLVKFNDKIYLAKRNVPSDVDLDNPYYWEIFMDAADSKRVDELFEKIGNLDELETESKDALVAAINEVNSIRPDWNQNDETAADYVKNRICYKEEIPEQHVVLCENVHVNNVYQINDLANISEHLQVGTTYTVDVDGYTSTATAYDANANGVGLNLSNSSGGIGMIFEPNSSGKISWSGRPNLSFTFSISRYQQAHTVYHKIDSNYLSSEIFWAKITQDDDGNVTSDKTPDEIAAAYEAGRAVYAKYTDIDRAGILSLSFTSAPYTIFTGTVVALGPPFRALVMYINGAWSAQFSPLGNVVTELSNSSTDNEVPSAKCVYDTMNQSLQYALPLTRQLGIADAKAGQLAKIKTVNSSGNPTSWEAVDMPSATDLSLGLTSASVGQIIKIKAVDESGKPTAWEAADMSADEQWELLGTLDASTGDVLQLDFSNPVKKLYFYSSLCDTAGEQYGASTTVYRQVAFKVGDRWRDVHSFKIGCCKHSWCWKTRYWLECGANLPYPKGEWTESLSAGNVAIKLTPLEIGNNNQYSSGLVSGIRFSLVLPDGTENTASGTIKVWGVKA